MRFYTIGDLYYGIDLVAYTLFTVKNNFVTVDVPLCENQSFESFHTSATFFHKEKYYMPAMEKHADCDAQADYSKFLAFQSQSSNDGLIWLDFASQIMRSGMKFQV